MYLPFIIHGLKYSWLLSTRSVFPSLRKQQPFVMFTGPNSLVQYSYDLIRLYSSFKVDYIGDYILLSNDISHRLNQQSRMIEFRL